MKLLVRASILSVAMAGIIAGLVPSRSSAQATALSNQVISSAMPAPACGPYQGDGNCNIRDNGHIK